MEKTEEQGKRSNKESVTDREDDILRNRSNKESRAIGRAEH